MKSCDVMIRDVDERQVECLSAAALSLYHVGSNILMHY